LAACGGVGAVALLAVCREGVGGRRAAADSPAADFEVELPAAVSAGVSGTGDDGAGAARACAAAGVDVSCVSARAGGVGSAVDGVDGAVAALAGGVTSGLAAVGGAGAAGVTATASRGGVGATPGAGCSMPGR